MFDKLIDLLIEGLDSFRFWQVVLPYERAVIVTLGRRVRERGPGLWFIWPFHIDHVMYDNVVPKTTNLNTQVLTTVDGETVVIGAMVRWQVKNVRKILLEVEHADHAFADVCYGVIGELVIRSKWEDIGAPDFMSALHRQMRKNAKRWGIDVQAVRLTDHAKAKALRLIGDTHALKDITGASS